MLTTTARNIAAELDLVVAPTGSDTAKFKIGKVQFSGADAAQVACTLSDVDSNQQWRSEELHWTVRREPDGWRIAGVAATAAEGETPRTINFESRKQMAELYRPAHRGNSRLQRAENPENSIRR